MPKKIIITNTSQNWNSKKRYKINEVVSYNGLNYQNSTGFNTEPQLELDWIVINKSASWGSIIGTLSDQNDLVNALNLSVPYTGATNDVNIGTNDFYTNKVFLHDEPNGAYGSVHLTDGVFHVEDIDGHSMITFEDEFFTFAKSSSIRASLDLSYLTINRDYLFPDESGILALRSDIPGLSGTTNYLSKFTDTSTLGNSQIFDNGTNVGVGTIAPQNKFHAYGSDIVVGNDLFYAGRFSNNSNKAVVIGYDSENDKGHIGSVSPGFAWTDLILNANGGNVGIGDKLLIKTTTEFTSNCTTHIATRTNGAIVIRDVAANGVLQLYQQSSGANVGSITQNGVTTSYNVTSDYRLKQDFKKFIGLDLVSKIKVYDYEWKSDKSRMNGVIAHELQEIIPYAVFGKKDDEQMQQVDYSKLVPILVQSIQEQQTQIEELKTLINKL